MHDPIFRKPEFPFIESEEQNECSPFDCMCGIYDNTYDNYFYSHKQNLAQQYIAWIRQWKKHHWEIQKTCNDLRQASRKDEYDKEFMDGISTILPNSVSLNTDRMEEGADKFVRELMGSNQGTCS